MSLDTPDIPSLSSQVPAEVRRAFDALRGWLGTARRQGGVVTADAFASELSGGLPPGLNDYSIPLRLSGLTALGAFRTIILSWDAVSANYTSFSYVEVYRNTEDDLGTAEMVGTTPADVYSDAPPQASRSVTYYYWVRAVSKSGVYGPYNATAGTAANTADDPAYLLELLAGEITSSELHSTLTARIDLVDAAGTGLVARMGLAEADLETVMSLVGDISSTDFDVNSLYAVGALVRYQGNIYKCILDINSTPAPDPTNTTYWDLVGEYASIADAVAANAAGISSLDLRVDGAEGDITAQAGRIDGLEATVDNATTGLAATRALLINDYSTTATTTSAIASAKSQAVAEANSNTAVTLQDYTNTANMTSAITSARDQAIATAGANTAATLTSYTNTADMNSAISTAKSEAVAESNGYTATQLTDYYTKAGTDGAIATSSDTLLATINKTYRQTTAPTNPTAGRALVAGDVWFDSDAGNKQYRWSGSAWELTQDTSIPANSAAIQTEKQVRATTTGPDWALDTTYYAGKVVVYANALYQCISNHYSTAGNAPPNATYWKSVTTSLYAQYTVKTDVNGKVVGFGLANDGVTSSFEIVVDKFAIVKADGTGTTIPFAVNDAGQVLISNALITDLTSANIAAEGINADRINASSLSALVGSFGYLTASTITGITIDGVDINGSVITGSTIQTATGNANVVRWHNDTHPTHPNSIVVYDADGVVRVKMGRLA